MADNPIWERQPSDTEKSWEAFQVYRDMGRSRSLRKVSDQIYGESTANLRYVEQWSSAQNWVERCEAYDADQDEKRSKRLHERRLEIEERSLDWYARVSLGIEKMLANYESINWSGADAYKISGLISLMQKATDEGRRAVGLPHRVTESKIDANVTATVEMTWEELMRRNTDDDDDSDD